jgi:hypothetical protein
MAAQYRVVTFKLDTAGAHQSDKTRYKIVAYDAVTSKRVEYVYNDDPEKGLERLLKRLPPDAQVTLEKGY